MGEWLRYTFGVLGNAASLLLYLSPILTFKMVVKKRSTEGYSCVPYIVALLNCAAAMWYTSPVVNDGWKHFPVFAINGVGALLELAYILIYLCFAPTKQHKAKVVGMTLLVAAMCGGIAAASILGFPDPRRRQAFVGYLGLATSVALFTAPFVAVKGVIKTKSVEFMPFYLSFFTLISCSAWLAYGLLSRDFNLWAPNVVGCPLDIIQLGLYCKYRKKTVGTDSLAPHKGEDLESHNMGSKQLELAIEDLK